MDLCRGLRLPEAIYFQGFWRMQFFKVHTLGTSTAFTCTQGWRNKNLLAKSQSTGLLITKHIFIKTWRIPTANKYPIGCNDAVISYPKDQRSATLGLHNIQQKHISDNNSTSQLRSRRWDCGRILFFFRYWSGDTDVGCQNWIELIF